MESIFTVKEFCLLQRGLRYLENEKANEMIANNKELISFRQ